MKLTIIAATGGVGRELLEIVVVSAAPVSTVPSPGRPNPPKHDSYRPEEKPNVNSPGAQALKQAMAVLHRAFPDEAPFTRHEHGLRQRSDRQGRPSCRIRIA